MKSISQVIDHRQPDAQVGRRFRSWIVWLISGTTALLICVFWRGGYWLVRSDELPARADVAVVLQGSLRGERARIAGAVALVQRGTAGRILLSVPEESYWGESVPTVAQDYLARAYGNVASKIEFCETTLDVSSTEQEAVSLISCIQRRGWRDIVVVTSNYHTRRAGIIWTKAVQVRDPSLHLWMHGVTDPEYHPKDWWRERLSAKTWLLEFMKLIWTVLG
ncbi:MAG: hypothetical protein DMG97_22405 [Acidobacteria bacterium]|nr:MAG: hypothetical protein DMG97_22405 [Acidobacteriota bacterium]